MRVIASVRVRVRVRDPNLVRGGHEDAASAPGA